MSYKRCTRAEDELLLRILRARESMSSTEIGAPLGISGTYVRRMTNRVRAADLEQSGERAEVVMAAYGWQG